MCRSTKKSTTSKSLRCHPIAKPPLSTPDDSLKHEGALWTGMKILSTLRIKTSLARFGRAVMYMHQIRAPTFTIKASLEPSQVKLKTQNSQPHMMSAFEKRLKLESHGALRSIIAKRIMLQQSIKVIAMAALFKAEMQGGLPKNREISSSQIGLPMYQVVCRKLRTDLIAVTDKIASIRLWCRGSARGREARVSSKRAGSR